MKIVNSPINPVQFAKSRLEEKTTKEIREVVYTMVVSKMKGDINIPIIAGYLFWGGMALL